MCDKQVPWYIKEGLPPGYDTHHAVTAYHFRCEIPTTLAMV